MSLQVLYGGTFDPVHNGHVAVAVHARDALAAEVRLMPAADPPHKGPTQASAQARADMLQLAIDGIPGLQVDLRELRRDGPSYTVDTLLELREQAGPDQPWAILIGADSFRAFDTWHRWGEVFDLAHVVVAERPGSPIDGQLPADVAAEVAGRWCRDAQELHLRPAGGLFALRQPLFPESASEIRRRIAVGGPWRGWVAPAVAGYIDAHGLYSRSQL